MTSIRLRVEPPCERTLAAYAANAACPRSINHKFYPGGARPERGLRIMQISGTLGHGGDCYRRAVEQLHAWDMHRGSATTGLWTDDELSTLVTYAKLAPFFWVLNPCRVLRSVEAASGASSRRVTTVGYATTRGHLLAGCELMTVRQDSDTGEVKFEVLSSSRGSGLIGRAIFPLLAPAQLRYFREQVRCMQEGSRVH